MSRLPNRSSVNRIQCFTTWFEEAYETHFERLYRYAFSITKNKQLAEDVVAEVFANIWSKKPDYTIIRGLSAYLHVAVKHQAIRLASQNLPRFSYLAYDESLSVSDAVDPESLLMSKELEQILAQVISNLPPHGKLVYDFSRNQGYSHQQIAEELGISKRTVESHLHQVLKKMKEALQAYFQQSGTSYRLLTRIAVWIMLISNAATDMLG